MGWERDPKTGKLVWVPDDPTPTTGGVFRTVNGRLLLLNPVTGGTIKDYGPQPQSPDSERGVITVMNGRRVMLDPTTGAQIIDLGPDVAGPENPAAAARAQQGLDLEAARLGLAGQQFAATEAARAEEARFRQTQLAQSGEQFGQTFGLQQQQFAEQIRANQQAELAARENMRFLREKMAVEQASDDKRLALQTAQLIDQVQGRLERLAFERTQLVTQAQQAQAQFDFQASQANQRAQQDADQINEQRRQSNLANRRGVAGDIALLSQDPGSRAALASFLGAMTGEASPFSTAIAEGQDFRTDESLFPLMQMLAEQQELQKGPQFFTPHLINAPNVPIPQFAPIQAPDFSQLFNTARDVQGIPQPPAAAGAGQQPASASPLTNEGALNLLQTNQAGLAPAQQQANLDQLRSFFEAQGLSKPEGKAKGGKSDSPVTVVGEEGAEVVIDLPDGIFVLNEKQLGFDPKKLTANKAADGGFFSSINPLQFLNQSVQRASAGTPFAGSIPTPVGVSAPGTPQFLQQFAAGLASTGRGVLRPLFFNELARIAPAGVPQSIMRRTA